MRYEYVLKGLTPLLMHADDVDKADAIGEWRKHPDNQNVEGKAKGDDRSPAWTWMTYLYHDGERIGVPFENIQKCLSEAGSKIILKGTTTLKQQAVSLVFFEQDMPPFTVKGKPVPLAPYAALERELRYTEHLALVRKVGQFGLMSKRATIGATKNVRVRPKFDAWEVRGTVEILDPQVVTQQRLEELFRIAGRLGIGDWRPSSPKRPGWYGMFTHLLRLL